MTNGHLKFLILVSFQLLVCNLFSQTIPPGKVINTKKIRPSEKLKKLSPGGDQYTPEERNATWHSILNNHTLKSSLRNDSPWELVGPKGIIRSEGAKFICSGRIRDIEIINDTHIRIASASGGLWDIMKGQDGKVNFQNLSSSQVSSSWSGTVATDPFDTNIILYGTGEPAMRGGSGLWRSQDNGVSWSHIPLDGGVGMGAFDEMEFTNRRGKVWTCGSEGVFYSDNSGTSWQKMKNGNHPGMVVYPDQADTVLVAEYDRGIYRTYNGGKSWQHLSNGLPPIESFNRIELSNCKAHPEVIYALYTKKDGFTYGIYKTTDGGNVWERCTVINADGVKDVDYHWGMAGYCSFISVSPTNPNHVISGGGWYIYSEDGKNFYGPTDGQHADFHAGAWSKDGQKAWFGNDGGLYSTTFDQKWVWNLEYNDLPITQFVSLAVSRTHPNVMIGGTQDNGLVYYNDVVKKWFYYYGDGGGVAIDPNNHEKIYGIIGLNGGPLSFLNVRKFGSSAAGWQEINVGLYPSGQWFRHVDIDQNKPPTLFTQTDNKLYYSSNQGDTWDYLGFQDLNLTSIHSLKTSPGELPKIYVGGYGPLDEQLMVLDFGIWEWTNITKGLPTKNDASGFSTPTAFPSDNPNFENRVYAVMVGYGPHLQGKSIFRSDSIGLEWINITGNLPNVPYLTVFEHPKNDKILVAGTDGFGSYITEDGGNIWKLWDDGLPKGALITDIDYQQLGDSTFVVVSTYGHSIWRRLLPTSISSITQNESHQPYTNHIINAQLTSDHLEVELSKGLGRNATIMVCNVEGKCVLKLPIDASINHHTIPFEPMVSGIYMVSLQQGGKLIGSRKVFGF